MIDLKNNPRVSQQAHEQALPPIKVALTAPFDGHEQKS